MRGGRASSFAAAEADRRVANLVLVGRVVSVSGAAGTVRVRSADLETHDVPVMQRAAGAIRTYEMPSVGEQVVLLSPSGDLGRAFVIGSLPAGNRPSSDAGRHTLDLGGATLEIVNGDVNVAGGDVTADGISLKTHVHGGVDTGLSKTQVPE